MLREGLGYPRVRVGAFPGNAGDGHAATYNWTIPDDMAGGTC
eukprot:gene4576-16289_t